MRIRLGAGLLLLLALAAPAFGACDEHFDSTFDMIQTLIFERHGCTAAACHSGAAPAGELDLTRGVAYANLLDQPVRSIASAQFPNLLRVVPANKGRSLLWLNLAAASQPERWQAPLRPMPLGGLPPLAAAELELVQRWIEDGAPLDGVVPGTAELFDACLPPAEPLQVKPLDPPPPGVGVQIRAPRQVLPPSSERETCSASYYDLTDQVPAEFRTPDGSKFRYKNIEARQDPLSHHAVVIAYTGATPITAPVWGSFACRGGVRDGQACTPTDTAFCGADGVCASPPVPSVACIGFGPGDAGIGNGSTSLFTSMGSSLSGRDGVYDEAPLKGILVWNSHAYNVVDQPAKLDMWVNFTFAAPDEQRRPLRRFVDVTGIAKMVVPPFAIDEVCHHYVLPANTRLLDMSSHTHKRGKRFRAFAGRFACASGPNAGQPCSPYGPDPIFPVRDLCAGAPCESVAPPAAGDCNGDEAVSIDELVLGVGLALDGAPAASCERFDANGDAAVTVEELIAAVGAAVAPRLRDPDESLLYTSLTYADALILGFDPLLQLGPRVATDAERTVTYCALYDNGWSNPAEVKRRSLTPTNGFPCAATHCAAGALGAPCRQNSECDSSPGAGDGACDACTVGFGVTTDDEMFVLTGSYLER
ncbi:MAG: hypothetical protein SF182_25745 [Deltaproteobacteria bacterium]|nr:hypothetical protein [Deltaproteobacteria bacterium]